MISQPNTLKMKWARLQTSLREMKRVAVAFSGGVDSTFLLKVCKDVLGENVLAITVRSGIVSRREGLDAVEIARHIGAKQLISDSGEVSLEDFVNNPPDRCYICRKARFEYLIKLAHEEGFVTVADGENADDRDDYRPGIRASRELGVLSPLAEADLTKQEIRSLSQQLNLPTWNKPADSCLATRIPYGELITEEKLRQVDSAEEFIRTLVPSVQIRVRHHGNTGRIEIEPSAISSLMKSFNRESILEHFKELGFQYATVDLEGYTMGSLNRLIETGSR